MGIGMRIVENISKSVLPSGPFKIGADQSVIFDHNEDPYSALIRWDLHDVSWSYTGMSKYWWNPVSYLPAALEIFPFISANRIIREGDLLTVLAALRKIEIDSSFDTHDRDADWITVRERHDQLISLFETALALPDGGVYIS